MLFLHAPMAPTPRHAHAPCPCAVATAGGADLYPAASAAAIDGWLATARGIEAAAAAWCQPTAGAASAEQRAEARAQLEAALGSLQAALGGGAAYLAGAAPSIADVAVLAALLALYQEVLGQDVQQQYGAVTAWLQACAAQPQFAAVLGAWGRAGWACWVGSGGVG